MDSLFWRTNPVKKIQPRKKINWQTHWNHRANQSLRNVIKNRTVFIGTDFSSCIKNSTKSGQSKPRATFYSGWHGVHHQPPTKTRKNSQKIVTKGISEENKRT